MDKKWTVLDALRHSRHDWLNRLQLVKAHLSLGSAERVHELIEEFVGESQQEARLMNLKIPLFAELLLTYSWEPQPCSLEYEILSDIHTLSHLDEELTAWTKRFLSVLHPCLDQRKENHLCVTVDQEEEDIRFFFDFRGKLTSIEKMTQWLAKQESSVFSVSYSLDNEEGSVALQLKEK